MQQGPCSITSALKSKIFKSAKILEMCVHSTDSEQWKCFSIASRCGIHWSWVGFFPWLLHCKGCEKGIFDNAWTAKHSCNFQPASIGSIINHTCIYVYIYIILVIALVWYIELIKDIGQKLHWRTVARAYLCTHVPILLASHCMKAKIKASQWRGPVMTKVSWFRLDHEETFAKRRTMFGPILTQAGCATPWCWCLSVGECDAHGYLDEISKTCDGKFLQQLDKDSVDRRDCHQKILLRNASAIDGADDGLTQNWGWAKPAWCLGSFCGVWFCDWTATCLGKARAKDASDVVQDDCKKHLQQQLSSDRQGGVRCDRSIRVVKEGYADVPKAFLVKLTQLRQSCLSRHNDVTSKK